MTHDLTTLETFLQTIEHGEKPDDLERVAGLDRWARATGSRARASAADLPQARGLREAIRTVVAAPTAPAGRGRLAAATRDYELRAGDPTAGEPALVPLGAGIHAALGQVVASYAIARATGAIDRLKLCANCGFAFVDESRNRSRRWCEMRSCGNQRKVRAYRSRRRQRSSPAESVQPEQGATPGR